MRLPELIIGFLLMTLVSTAFASEITAEDAKLRHTPGDRPDAGYLSLTNGGNQPIALIGARAEAYNRVELHRSVMHDGSMHMESQEAIDIPAGETLVLMPGDYHLMFMGALAPVTIGDRLTVTLIFSDGHEVDVQFAVVGMADEI